jgi:hypothetical protein
MPLVINTTNAMRGLPRLGKAGEKQVVLLPGANEVKDEYWAEISAPHVPRADGSVPSDHAVNDMVERGILVVKDSPKATKDWAPGGKLPFSLGELKEKSAFAAIGECKDQTQLENWLSTDGRKSVREALTRRAYAIAPQGASDTSLRSRDVEMGQ